VTDVRTHVVATRRARAAASMPAQIAQQVRAERASEGGRAPQIHHAAFRCTLAPNRLNRRRMRLKNNSTETRFVHAPRPAERRVY